MYHFRILRKALFLIVAQLVKEFPPPPPFCGTRQFISLREPANGPNTESFESSLLFHILYLRSILVLSSLLHPCFMFGLLHSSFVSKIFISHLSRACYMTWQFLLFLLFQSRQYRSLYCCIRIGWVTEICFIMWFISIYTSTIHLCHCVLHPHIRYMKSLFHYKYPYVKFLFVMCFIHRYPYMKHVSLYVPVHETRVSLCASSRGARIQNMFHLCFIPRYPYMKHLFHYVLHPHIPYTKHVSLCILVRETCFVMFFIHRYSYMKYVSFLLHPQIPV
jgi:hypothetical protein